MAKALADNWQVSGVTSILSGVRQGFSYGYTGVPTGALTGQGSINGGGSRVNILCDPNLPRGERTFERQFRTECIGPPTDQFRLGNSTQRRVHRTGLHELGHLGVQARPDGRQPAPAVPDRALQRVQHRSVAADRVDTSAMFNYVDRRADRRAVRQPDRRRR